MGAHQSGIDTAQTAAAEASGGSGENEGEIQPGTMVGEYCIEGTLGEGGMGRVYSATHPVIAKRAAIKVLHPELSAHKEAVDRFVQEARAVNQIGHPNIVDIFSFGTMADGRCYFVMEWLRGKSLRERIAASRLPLGDVLQILDTIAVALEAAHEKGIVHRDLKPDNIFLVDVKGDKPAVKLLDFGIAKLIGGDARMERTRTGNLMGTPAYISPEQARGHAVDHRTDVYALGGVAYELLTGELPFPADNAADMIAKHLFAPPPSAMALNTEVTADLDQLVQRLLAKDVDARPTLVETRQELRAIRSRLAFELLSPSDGGYTEPQIPAQHGAQPTPRPGLRTPPPGLLTPTGMALAAPAPVSEILPVPRRSKAPLYAVAGIVGLALGAVVFTQLLKGDDGDDPRPPIVAPPPVVEQTRPPTTPPPPPPDPGSAAAVIVDAPPDVGSGSGAATPVVTTTKPVTRKPVIRKPVVKKPTTKKPTPEDDDAPM